MAASVLIGEHLAPLIVRGTGLRKNAGVTSCPKLFHVGVHRASPGESFRFDRAECLSSLIEVVGQVAVRTPDAAVTQLSAMWAEFQ